MKKVLFLTTLLLLSFTVTTLAQTGKEARAARREALKKEREARRALEAQQDSVAYFKATMAFFIPIGRETHLFCKEVHEEWN